MENLRDQEGGRSALLNNNPAMLVADVATAPPDWCWRRQWLYTLYLCSGPVEGKLRIVKGGLQPL